MSSLFPYGRAICYSGFREGQSPETSVFPTYKQVKEDLLLLHGYWFYLRLYDCDQHAETVLEVIQKEGLNFKVLQGAYVAAEVNNPNCAWGGIYTDDKLKANKFQNLERIERLSDFANRYPDIICALSIGNEAAVEWTDHLISVDSLINYAAMVKRKAKQPVTFCDNYVPWLTKLAPLAEYLDFISVHTYPVWEYKSIEEALLVTQQNYYDVCAAFPNKTVIITEAGWTTNSNGRGIEPSNASEELQRIYFNQLLAWADYEGVLTYFFEAFDEPWKGSPDPQEPEKHWGIYRVDRKPKYVLRQFIS